MRTRHYIFISLLILFFIFLRFRADIGPDHISGYTVVKIIDGDTVKLKDRGKVRLLGIDTPEHGEPFCDSATIYLAKLILGRQVNLRFGHRQRDRYGRLLAYLFLDSLFVNRELIRKGYARVYFFADNAKSAVALNSTLLAAQREAMQDTVGLWTLPYQTEKQYIGNKRTFRFHRPDCPSAEHISPANKIIFRTRNEACWQGYSPCRNCKP